MCNSIPEKIKIAKVGKTKSLDPKNNKVLENKKVEVVTETDNKNPINKHKKIFILLETFLSVPNKNIAAINNIAVKNSGLDNSVRKKSLCLVAVYPEASNREINSFIE